MSNRRPLYLVLALSLLLVLGGAHFSQSSVAADPKAPAKDFPLEISLGVGLAQTGPNGTLMSFGCQYKFKDGARKSADKYAFVVSGKDKKPVAVPIDLEDEGEMLTLVDGWRPENGPYEGHIEIYRSAKDHTPISTSIDFPLTGDQAP